MKRSTAAILLMLSLGALVAGRLSAAVADDGVDTIRLPSHGPGVAGHEATVAAAAATEEERPWECCDLPVCAKSFPPICRCTDKVKECAKACNLCEEDDESDRYVCRDWYTGDPGPRCSNSVAADVALGN